MLQPYVHILASKRIVLASASPRRKQILENIVGFSNFKLHVSNMLSIIIFYNVFEANKTDT